MERLPASLYLTTFSDPRELGAVSLAERPDGLDPSDVKVRGWDRTRQPIVASPLRPTLTALA